MAVSYLLSTLVYKILFLSRSLRMRYEYSHVNSKHLKNIPVSSLLIYGLLGSKFSWYFQILCIIPCSKIESPLCSKHCGKCWDAIKSLPLLEALNTGKGTSENNTIKDQPCSVPVMCITPFGPHWNPISQPRKQVCTGVVHLWSRI